eukprot:gene9938-2120_t
MSALGVGHHHVIDANGNARTMASLCDHRRCIIEYIEDLAKVPQNHLGDVSIIVIGCAPHKFISTFVSETNYPYEMYSDSDRAVYSALDLKVGHAYGTNSPHVRSSVIGGLLKSTWRGMKSMQLQGNVKQQGGAFVVNGVSEVLLSHHDASPADHCPIDKLLTAAGLPPFFSSETSNIDISSSR